MNSMLKAMTDVANCKLTENGGKAYKSTLNATLDMFALCGAYRNRSEEDCIFMFNKAFAEDKLLALKCLFYLGDCRGGQGERRFFRVCYEWLCQNYPDIARANLKSIPIYRRWDDVIYSCLNTPVWEDAMTIIKEQLILDMVSKTPSLLAKWLPSENASSKETIRIANMVRKYLGMTHKQYRKTLTVLRERINIVEKLMSENRWDEIEFDKLPSKAGLKYKNAFAHKEITMERYKAFMENKKTKVNAKTLYPYEVVEKAINCAEHCRWGHNENEKIDRLAIEKYWNNLPDYFGGKQSNMLCVVDTSGSMWGTPIDVAISLGIYAAERAGGPFKDHYISFSSRPQLIKVEGIDFVDKVERIYRTNLCENTDLIRTFDLLLHTILSNNVKKEDIPDTICVISDMEIDAGTRFIGGLAVMQSEMETMRQKWALYGLELPRLVYWNVEARNNTFLEKDGNVALVSGFSPSIFESIVTGKTGVELMLDKLNSERYSAIIV